MNELDLVKRVAVVLQRAYESLGGSRWIQTPQWRPLDKQFRHSKLNDCLLIYLKGVRSVSLLNASIVLLEAGHVQEIGILCRCMDEVLEDISLFMKGLGEGGKLSHTQQRVFEDFFQEELEGTGTALRASAKRDRVLRKHVRAAIAGLHENTVNPHDHNQMMKTIDSVFSGYVHGAYPHIMEMCVGLPHRYMMSGMRGTPRIDEWRNQLLLSSYRVVLGAIAVGKRLGELSEVEKLLSLRTELELYRPEFAADPNALLRELKKKA